MSTDSRDGGPGKDRAQPEAPDEGRPLWVLTRDEQRILLITSVGGLASIIAGAVILGAVVALARSEQHSGMTISHLKWLTLLWPLVMLAVGFLMELLLKVFSVRPKWQRRTRAVVEGPLTLIFLVLLLTWIGMAAGVH